MPKPTFFNLKEEKRRKIEESAIKEFGSFGFHGARLNNIVQEAEIAKGSFYQYFEDLDDLFKHLLVSFTSQKMNVIYSELKKHRDDDFFTKIAAAQKAGLHFVNTVGEDVMKMFDQSIPEKISESEEMKELTKKSEESFYKPLIQEAIKNGEIINNEALAYTVVSNSGRMSRQYLINMKHPKVISEIFRNEKEFENAVDLIINFIKQGLKAEK